MATRATIKIEGIDFAKVYKHFDGGPNSTLPWLNAFNKTFTENRGNDPEYKFAQLLRSSQRDQDEYQLDSSKYTGWGIIPFRMSCGEEYEYTLKADGTVTFKRI